MIVLQEIDTKSISIIEKKRPELLSETATERAERMSRQVRVWNSIVLISGYTVASFCSPPTYTSALTTTLLSAMILLPGSSASGRKAREDDG